MHKSPVTFSVNNQQLVGTMFYPDKSGDVPAVIFYHGRGSMQERLMKRAEALCQRGFIALTFSFRGCGESEGEFAKQTTEDGIHDALTAFDFLCAQKQVHKDKMGIWGGSFGGYLAAIVSARRKVQSLILAAPAIYRNEWCDITYDQMPVRAIQEFRNKADFADTISIEAIQQYTGNLLVIEHEKDEVIPSSVVRAYYDYAKEAHKEYAVIKDAPHTLRESSYYDEVTQLTIDWFQKSLDTELDSKILSLDTELDSNI